MLSCGGSVAELRRDQGGTEWEQNFSRLLAQVMRDFVQGVTYQPFVEKNVGLFRVIVLLHCRAVAELLMKPSCCQAVAKLFCLSSYHYETVTELLLNCCRVVNELLSSCVRSSCSCYQAAAELTQLRESAPSGRSSRSLKPPRWPPPAIFSGACHEPACNHPPGADLPVPC